jgi:dihydropteroate synthase
MIASDFATRRDAFLAALRQRPLVMGVLNVTPDSFSDGGRYYDLAAATAQAARLVAEGADALDVGAESTRPGHAPLSLEAEWARLERHLPAALAAAGERPVSIDTTKAAIARRATALGCVIVNDQWGLQADPAMAEVVAASGAAFIAMHNRVERDEALDVAADMRRFFDETLRIAQRAGIPFERIILDPGVGFGKTPRQNCEAVARMPELADYGLPWLAGLSRKSFLQQFVEGGPQERLFATIGAHLAAAASGASILRVHDVKAHVEALAAWRGVLAARR